MFKFISFFGSFDSKLISLDQLSKLLRNCTVFIRCGSNRFMYRFTAIKPIHELPKSFVMIVRSLLFINND